MLYHSKRDNSWHYPKMLVKYQSMFEPCIWHFRSTYMHLLLKLTQTQHYLIYMQFLTIISYMIYILKTKKPNEIQLNYTPTYNLQLLILYTMYLLHTCKSSSGFPFVMDTYLFPLFTCSIYRYFVDIFLQLYPPSRNFTSSNIWSWALHHKEQVIIMLNYLSFLCTPLCLIFNQNYNLFTFGFGLVKCF